MRTLPLLLLLVLGILLLFAFGLAFVETAQATPDESNVIVVVRRGQTVSGIAQRHHVSVEQLRAWNSLRSVHAISEGQRLRVASPGVEAAALANIPPSPAGLGSLLWRVIKWIFGAFASLFGLRVLGAVFTPAPAYRAPLPVPVSPRPTAALPPPRIESQAPVSRPAREAFVKERRLIVHPDGRREAVEVTVLVKIHNT